MSTEKIIYWKKFRKPRTVYDPILKTDREVAGEYVCKDKRVKWVALVGFLKTTNNEMGISLEIIFKDDERKTFVAKEVHSQIEGELIFEAEQYLKSKP